MTTIPPHPQDFEFAIRTWRPQLLRYCARIAGSIADGEDIVQDTLLKAQRALASAPTGELLGAWLMRIAHNQAIDHLRRLGRLREEPIEEAAGAVEESSPLERKEMAEIALAYFLRLTPLQRSSVFLKDVMGYSLEEIAEFHGTAAGAVKAVLHRGRARLRALARQEVSRAEHLGEVEKLQRYVERFNARDFDAIRAMLADDVRLDLPGRPGPGEANARLYLSNYGARDDWRLAQGWVDGAPAVLVYDTQSAGTGPAYFALIEWDDSRIVRIRDFRYARHVMAEGRVQEP